MELTPQRRVFLLLLAGASCPPIVFARAGGGGGYHSGGGHSYSGSSYSGYSGSGSYGYGSGGADPTGSGIFLFLFVIVVLLYFATRTKDASPSDDEDDIAPHIKLQREASRDQDLEALRRADPAFDPEAFLARVRLSFLAIQKAWSDQNLTGVRGSMSDGVFERFNRLIAEQVAAGERNVMGNVQVLECEILGVRVGTKFKAAFARIRASSDDRTVSLANNEILASDSEPFEEVWTFLRRPGTKTRMQQGPIEGHCPNCGSPLQIADAVQCETCKTWVNSGEYDWVLVEITQAAEWARPPSQDAIPGWIMATRTDPALSVEAIEDRASVVFWRWVDARRRNDPAPLKAVTMDEAMHRWPWGEQQPREAAVGAVDLLAIENGGARERAHVRVKWEAEMFDSQNKSQGRRRQRHLMVLERMPGAQSDPKAGLSTSRCSSCGAPPSEADAAVCAYCHTYLNDGRRNWVLADILPADSWVPPVTVSSENPLQGQPQRPTPETAEDWGDGIPPIEAVSALARVMAADGSMDAREDSYLENYASQRGVSAAQLATIRAAAQGGHLPLPHAPDAHSADLFLRGLIRMSLADGRISPEELALLTAFGAEWGINPTDISLKIGAERRALQTRIQQAAKPAGPADHPTSQE